MLHCEGFGNESTEHFFLCPSCPLNVLEYEDAQVAHTEVNGRLMGIETNEAADVELEIFISACKLSRENDGCD